MQELCLEALHSDEALPHVCEELWRDRSFVRRAVALNEAAVEYSRAQEASFLVELLVANPLVFRRLPKVEDEVLLKALVRNARCFEEALGQRDLLAPPQTLLLKALSASKELLPELPATLLEDRDFVARAIEVNPTVLSYTELRADRSFIASVAQRHARALGYAEELRRDKDFVLTLIVQMLGGFGMSSGEGGMCSFLIIYVILDIYYHANGFSARNPACLGYADPPLLTDPSFNLGALRRNSMARHYVAPELWHSRSFLLDAVEPFGLLASVLPTSYRVL